MADNVGYTPGTGALVASDEVTYSSDTSLVQLMRPVLVTGSEGSKTVVDLPGDNTNGLDVDVTRVSGNVTVVQATAGNLNATVAGTVGVSSLPALVAGTAYVGRVRLTDGTNDLAVDTAFNDGETASENHIDVGARLMAVNAAGTFDMVRSTVSAFRCATYTTAQTGTALWTPASTRAVAVTGLQIQSYGTTAGTCIVWFGGSADTTYTRGTDLPLFDGEFAPSNTNKPGVFVTFPTPVRGTADFVLRVTTTNAQSVTVNVFGYEI